MTRAGAALGLGVPQLTVNPVSDSERRGYHSSDPPLTPNGWRNPGGQGSCLPFSPKLRPSHIPGKNRAREGQVRAQVSFLPERLQLSMAFEAPGLLWHLTGSRKGTRSENMEHALCTCPQTANVEKETIYMPKETGHILNQKCHV